MLSCGKNAIRRQNKQKYNMTTLYSQQSVAARAKRDRKII